MNRSHQLDFFRGLFLILILVDHYLTWDNLVMKFTSEFIGWVSAAEAFVFLSGLTAGLVYTYKLADKGEAYIKKAATKRALDIYKYHTILFLLTLLILFSHKPIRLFWMSTFSDIVHEPMLATLKGFLLLYQPLYLDILPMYAVFLLFVPLAIRSFRNGNHLLLLSISFLLYLIGTFELVSPLMGPNFFQVRVNLGYFNLLSWQFLFVIGIFIGFLAYYKKVERLKQNIPLLTVALIITITLFLLKLLDVSFLNFNLGFWTEKGHLRPLRLLNFAAIFTIVTFVSFRFRSWFKYKPINYLGKHSLEVFSFHILLIILFKPFGAYLNSLWKIKLSETTYIYPYSTLLLLVLIPALYVAPIIMKKRSYGPIKLKRPVS
ncbi:OpgC domain-containing protein [Pontibacter akesuensis]|nr:OpgC domain-containing protein [Pontibacter akesuensis]